MSLSSTVDVLEEWRDLWGCKFDFLLVAFSFSFSALNLLNLPALLLEFGGVPFIIAYLVCLGAVCLPVIIMELSMGQWVGRAPVQAFYSFCPIFKGVGVAQILLSLMVMSYASVYVGYVFWLIFYLFEGIANPLPYWLNCGQVWNTVECRPPFSLVSRWTNVTNTSIPVASVNTGAYFQFIERVLLKESTNSIDEFGEPLWRPAASTGLVWLIVFLVIFAGVRWLGKVFYSTFLIPLVLLAALTTRCLLEDFSAVESVAHHLFNPNYIYWEHLLQFDIWQRALKQTFYTSGIGFGVYITLGSYNKRNNNIVCDGLSVIFMHILLTTFQMAAVLGIIASTFSGLELIDLGPYLKTGIAQFANLLVIAGKISDEAKIWSFVVLLLVALLLINFIFLLSLNVLSSFEDALGETASRCFPRCLLAVLICLLSAALAVPHFLPAGRFTLELLHGSLDMLTLSLILFFEMVAIGWFYCAHRLGKNIHEMVGSVCCWIVGYFFVFLLYLTPLAPLSVVGYQLWGYDFDQWYNKGITSFEWSEAISWAIALLPLAPIPICALYVLVAECCCYSLPQESKWQGLKRAVGPKTFYEVEKPMELPRYPTTTPPGYVLLQQQAPLAEPENFADMYSEQPRNDVSAI